MLIFQSFAVIKSYIKNLEEMVDGYKKIMDNNSVKLLQANAEVANIIKMVGCIAQSTIKFGFI